MYINNLFQGIFYQFLILPVQFQVCTDRLQAAPFISNLSQYMHQCIAYAGFLIMLQSAQQGQDVLRMCTSPQFNTMHNLTPDLKLLMLQESFRIRQYRYRIFLSHLFDRTDYGIAHLVVRIK
ncbi:hypothetical protein D3C80_1652300 [compost metagenome]